MSYPARLLIKKTESPPHHAWMGDAMIELCLDAPDLEARHVTAIAHRLSPYFSAVRLRPPPMQEIPSKPGILPLEMRIVSEELPSPYTVDARRGITVSTWQSDGFNAYAGISLDTHVVLCALLGIAQWRALESNPLLQMEDLIHPTASNCLFTMPCPVYDYVLLLEEPCVCPGCVDFYHCLGVDRELVALRDTLNMIGESARIAQSSSSPLQY